MDEMENRIRDAFEQNYEFQKMEGGHVITNFIKNEALTQVLYYWKRNQDLIRKVTQAEVKLTLPELQSPNKKYKYTLEGVVDIVREGDETWMYDLKTHDRATIEGNVEQYRAQLNVYAYIWKTLRGNRLDQTAVISTVLPQNLKSAVRTGRRDWIDQAMQGWDPVVPLGYSEDEVEKMIEDFGNVVEAIEDHKFRPAPVERLNSKEGGDRNVFAVRVCRNCDVRFSCSSFREYVRQSDRGNHGMRKYMDDYGSDYSNEDFLEGNLTE